MKTELDESPPFDNIEEDLTNDFHFWKIADNGDITRSDREEVEIPCEALLNTNWLSHEIKKERQSGTASAESEFYFVFMEALRRAGYKQITIDVENIYAPICASR